MRLSCRPHCRQTCSRPQTNWLICVDLIAGHPSKGTNAAIILLSQAQITICASTIRKIHESWVLFPPMMNISIKKKEPWPFIKKTVSGNWIGADCKMKNLNPGAGGTFGICPNKDFHLMRAMPRVPVKARLVFVLKRLDRRNC